MSMMQLAGALLALLLAPGPTNTLLALAGAAGGLRRSLRLVPGALAGYLLMTVPLAVWGSRILDAVPVAGTAIKLAAALWVMLLAVRLWWPRRDRLDVGLVTLRQVFVTTLLNPKCLVIGLALLPPWPSPGGSPGASPGFWPALIVFAAVIPAVAAAWIAIGARATGGRDLPVAVRRLAAGWLALVSLGLALGAMRA